MNIDVNKLPEYQSKAIPQCIFAMASSGDYTLEQAITIYTLACDRCKQVLLQKYLKGYHGYFEYSEAWKNAGTECDFCKDMKTPESTFNHDKHILEPSIYDIQKHIPSKDNCIKLPLNSIGISGDKNSGTCSILYIDNFDITHIIGNWPCEFILRYVICSSRVILGNANIRYLHSGYGFSLTWDMDGIFKYKVKIGDTTNKYFGMGGLLDKSNIIKDVNNYVQLKGWNDYFNIDEVKVFLKTQYNVNSEELFPLT